MEDWKKVENNSLPEDLGMALVVVFSSLKSYHLCCGLNVPQLIKNMNDSQPEAFSLTHYKVLTLPPGSD